ncbi:hypothetical protein LTR37_013600 [Vermiconidia calcicola]|uniref:Uncharacterized protein n=1 Tax=Vermiconidia calcicola TaxID=1690605 RepID=A0ACC3MW73_9PEZI|nr:hypothetical protein LTR37_013600 [Vermiconidia calcicola]
MTSNSNTEYTFQSISDRESLRSGPTPQTSTQWLEVSPENVTYSSLVGVPLSPRAEGVNSTFRLQTEYWTLKCPTITAGALLEEERMVTDSRHRNQTGLWVGTAGSSSTLMSNTSAVTKDGFCGRKPSELNVQPRVIVYNAWPVYPEHMSPLWSFDRIGSLCYMKTSYVEMEVECFGQQCAAARVRRSTLNNISTSWTYLDDQECTMWARFAHHFVKDVDSHGVGEGTVPQSYLANPDTPSLRTAARTILQLDQGVYADRLAQLMNTFWSASRGYRALVEGLSDDNASQNATEQSRRLLPSFDTAQGQTSRRVEVVMCHRGWLAALLFTSLILLVASLIPAAVRITTHTPDLSFDISTMIRDNPYVATPPGGSTLKCSERARLLRDRSVRFGDVAPDNGVGHLAIGSIDNGYTVARVLNGRKYE